MADAKQQLLSYLPPDDEQVCTPDCVLVAEDGTELPAHQPFLFMHSKELGKMLAVAQHDDKGSKSLQTQDSAESLGLLLKELYNSTGAKSVISADTVLPLLLIADKYDVEAMVLRCAAWLNDFDGKRLKDTLLTVSPMRGPDIVANALAWLTTMTSLADPAPFNSFKRLCVVEAAAGMDWDSSRWAELPLKVVLAVCQALPSRAALPTSSSSRHLKQLKDQVAYEAKHIHTQLDRPPNTLWFDNPQ